MSDETYVNRWGYGINALPMKIKYYEDQIQYLKRLKLGWDILSGLGGKKAGPGITPVGDVMGDAAIEALQKKKEWAQNQYNHVSQMMSQITGVHNTDAELEAIIHNGNASPEQIQAWKNLDAAQHAQLHDLYGITPGNEGLIVEESKELFKKLNEDKILRGGVGVDPRDYIPNDGSSNNTNVDERGTFNPVVPPRPTVAPHPGSSAGHAMFKLPNSFLGTQDQGIPSNLLMDSSQYMAPQDTNPAPAQGNGQPSNSSPEMNIQLQTQIELIQKFYADSEKLTKEGLDSQSKIEKQHKDLVTKTAKEETDAKVKELMEQIKATDEFGAKMGEALAKGGKGAKAAEKAALKELLDQELAFLEKKVETAVISNTLGDITKLGFLGLAEAAAEGAAIQALFGAAKAKISGFALGTRSAPGGLALVGEEGPEYVNLPRGAQVYNNTETRNIANNNGHTFNIHVHDSQGNLLESATTAIRSGGADRFISTLNEHLQGMN